MLKRVILPTAAWLLHPAMAIQPNAQRVLAPDLALSWPPSSRHRSRRLLAGCGLNEQLGKLHTKCSPKPIEYHDADVYLASLHARQKRAVNACLLRQLFYSERLGDAQTPYVPANKFPRLHSLRPTACLSVIQCIYSLYKGMTGRICARSASSDPIISELCVRV